jgi:hypothetical protein
MSNDQVSDFVLMMGMAMISISGAVLFVDFGGSTGGHSSPWLLMLADVTVYSCMFQCLGQEAGGWFNMV